MIPKATEGGKSGVNEEDFATVSKSLRYCVRHIYRTQCIHATAGVF